MKKIILSLLLTASAVYSSFGQLTEGHISYQIDISTDNPDMQMAIGMMQGSSLDVYFKEKNTRAEMKMGAMMNVTTISNEVSGEILMLMSGMIGQNAIKSSLKELEAQNPDKPKLDVALLDETKEIQGYKCKKAILTDEDGGESTFWYTDEIVVSKKGQSYLNEDVPGFPMQYDLNNNDIKMTMTVIALDKKLDKKIAKMFDMEIPEGYKEMTMEELKSIGM